MQMTTMPVSPDRFDTRFHYPELGRRSPVQPTGHGECFLRVFRREVDVVIATELDDNPGMSITNAAEELHAAVAATAWVRPGFVLIEHYPVTRHGGTLPETFAQINMRDDRARWHGLARHEVEAMIGGPLP